MAPELTGVVGRAVEVRHLPHDRSFVEVFVDGDHLCTAFPAHLLTADETEAVIERRVQERRRAMNRFTTANRQRRSMPGTMRLETDRDGRRHVIEPVGDLLSGGNEAYARLITKSDNPNRLF